MNRMRVLREAVRSKRPSPMGALWRGLLAGAAGAAAQSLLFKLKKAPEPTKVPPDLGKPEPEARGESSLETVARRAVEGLAQRGPLDKEAKGRLASAIHYAFGAAWGGLYGLLRESVAIPPPAFGALVWLASDNVLLPAFRVAAWPQHYRADEHRYALQAHLAYGAATAGAYALLRNLGPVPLRLIPAVLAMQAWAFVLRLPPARLLRRRQPWPKRIVQGVLVQRVAQA
ncbi:MAG TPA: hypothetical protein VLW85_22145 [Myxococcales bacterium]|nr:hypothetical protein [Myxococcales bacterium]